MPKILRITQIGEPVLRKKSKPVKVPLSKELDRFIDDMIVTMKKARGVGVAAPHIFASSTYQKY